MKISIVTGCYNHAKQLPKLLKSLTEQREFVHEWLICDDGSPNPEMIKLLKDYEKLPNTRVFRQENKGMRLSKNINNGLREVTGDIVFIIMGDTYLEPDTLHKLNDTYVRDTAGSAIRRNVNEDGTHHSWDWRFGEDMLGKKIMLGEDKPFSHLTGNSMIVMRHHLEEIGYWPEEYEGYGFDDWCVFLRLQRLGVKLIAYNNIIVNHIYHEGKSPDNPINEKLFIKELSEDFTNKPLFQGI